jgi:hypothetical protein
LWEGITSGIGGTLSLTVYLLTTLLGGGRADPAAKHPVDSYGPLTQQPATSGAFSKAQFQFNF